MKIPIQAGSKDASKRVVDINNSMLKKFYDKNSEALRAFLSGIGYANKPTNLNRYLFSKPPVAEDDQASVESINSYTGNVEVLDAILKLFEAE